MKETKVKITVEGKLKNNRFTYIAITNFCNINKILSGIPDNIQFHITKELVLV